MTDQMTFFDAPPRPTLAYMRSLFKSEGLVCNRDHLEICQSGWVDASNDTDEERRKRMPRLLSSVGEVHRNGYRIDAYALGYVTYVRTYTQAMQ